MNTTVDFVKSFGEEGNANNRETAKAQKGDEVWEVVFSRPFLVQGASNPKFRAFYVPFVSPKYLLLFFLFLSFRLSFQIYTVFSDYVVLRNNKLLKRKNKV